MFKTLDVLIGLAVVMFMSSLIVTVITQFVISAWNARGKHLLRGVTDLLQQIDPGMERVIAAKISAAVLTHPLIRDVKNRYGSVIHRAELTKILMELGGGSGPQKLEEDARQRLLRALQANGVSDPAAAVHRVGEILLDLETSRPDLAASARHNLALVQGARSALVAKVNAWFDQTMDRVSERFTFTTRWITFSVALSLAFIVQLDALLLVNRLATDPQLRATMVQRAVAADEEQHQFDKLPPEERRQLFQELASADLLTVPGSFGEWKANWTASRLHPNPVGVLLTAVLLSFGAPFWYNILKNLLQLRSVLAQKDDAQRAKRQDGERVQERAMSASA
jgi:hypothetical protein